jgi:rod shape-determining protein MreC
LNPLNLAVEADVLRNRTFALLLILSLGHVLLISAQVQSKSGIPVLESVSFGVFAGVQKFTTGIADWVTSLWTNYFALRGVGRENAELRARILELEGASQQQEAATRRLRDLEDALGLKQALPAKTIAARVIAGNPSPGALTVTINRGSADGILPDMAVLGHRGVVGRVIEPSSPHAALVQLLIEPSAAAAVTLEKSGAGALVTGAGAESPMRLEYLPNVEITPGEKVFTSGKDLVYPAGFEIGVVQDAEPGIARGRKVTVRPSVDFSHLEIVLVVLSRPADAVPAPAPTASGRGPSKPGGTP